MNRPDPRSPLVLDTRKLDRRPGTMLELSRTVDLPEDLGTDVIAIKAGMPVELAVRLESVVEGVLLTGSVNGRASGACVRCLARCPLGGPARQASSRSRRALTLQVPLDSAPDAPGAGRG